MRVDCIEEINEEAYRIKFGHSDVFTLEYTKTPQIVLTTVRLH